MKYLLIVIFFTVLLTSCEKEQETLPKYATDKKYVIENQSYGNNPRNVMDLYLPKDRTEDTKTIILIHGGGWKDGDKSDFKDFASLCADSGINSITINYRYADAKTGVDYNNLLSDIEKAIDFLKHKRNEYGTDFKEITLLGASAGGHLALLYAYKSGNIENVISMAGPTDLNDEEILSINGMPALIDNLVGDNNFENRTKASPITYANSTATYLYHGKLDSIVPYSQSENLYKKIGKLNPDNKFTLFDDCGHEFNDESFFKVFQETIYLLRK